MPKYLTDRLDFTNSVPVPEDTDIRNAASVEEPFQALANRTAFLKDETKHLREELVYNPRRSRTIMFPAIACQGHRTINSPGDDTSDDGWARDHDKNVDNGELVSAVEYAECMFDLSPHLPDGSQLTNVRAHVEPGASSRSPGDRMFVEVTRITQDLSGPGLARKHHSLGSTSDNGTTSAQLLSVNITSEVNRAINAHYVRVRSGGPQSGDTLICLYVSFLDPGPRNY